MVWVFRDWGLDGKSLLYARWRGRFEGVLVAYQQSGDGAVVMTNAQGGLRLAYEVVRSIASVYGRPDFHPIVRTSVTVDPAILATYAGVYELSPTFAITITLENGQLME
jgi:hypothetical protein